MGHHNTGKDIEKPYVRPMRLGWRELFTSKVDAKVQWDRWDFLALGLAVFAVIWVFLLKLKTFYALGYTSDLFVDVQLARSWLEGRGLLYDNCFGNHLAIHTYFLLLPLGVIAGPALCLVLFYFLLQQRMLPSILTALAVISVKEDAPIAAGVVAIVAGVETWSASAGKHPRCRFNWPAAATLLLSVSAIPFLLAISWSQSPTMYARHSVDYIGIVAPGSLSSPGALFVFVISNITNWLGSSVVRQWLWVMIAGSFGTVLLRPYYLVAGVLTTVVAWLVGRNDLLWTPRFSSTEALLWCITLVAFASIAHAAQYCSKWIRKAAVTAAIAITALSMVAQVALVPHVYWAYLPCAATIYSRQEVQQADELFARYRREGKPEEPVVASTWLFRYAHDRNLFWLDRMHNRPAPVWILGDSADSYEPFRISSDTINPESGIHIEDYTLIDHRGRFVLLRKRE